MCERKDNSPVYVVEPERGGKRRTVHRNMLFHCGEELPDEPETDVVCQTTKETSKAKKATVNNDQHHEDDDASSNSDEEEKVQEHRTPRLRKKPTRLNYNGLGKPTVNCLTTSNGNKNNYRIWLEQLWIIGYWTDLFIKQLYPTKKPYKQTHVHSS